jgi:predicted metal-dependent phosphoesterase TrpH
VAGTFRAKVAGTFPVKVAGISGLTRYTHARVLKLELHAHTDDDPADCITHSTRQLIDRASALGYGALAITLHDRYFDPAPHAAYARDRGIVLLPGVERTISNRHVLLVNFPAGCADVRSFDDLAQLKRQCAGLVVAPHPFYPIPSSLGAALERHAAVFDAVEVNAMYTRLVDFNRRAIRWARAHGKPLVGNTDLHLLAQMGTTYSLVDAEPQADAICDAIRGGRVELRTEPLSSLLAARLFAAMLWGGIRGRHNHSRV